MEVYDMIPMEHDLEWRIDIYLCSEHLLVPDSERPSVLRIDELLYAAVQKEIEKWPS